jgi:coproporphyrinogen III oxidase
MHIGIVQEHVAWFEGGMDLTIHATTTQRAD